MLGGLAALAFAALVRDANPGYDIYDCQPGQPVPGLTARQLEIFNNGLSDFKHEFTPAEGLGPLFNGRSCFECHGKPGAAGLEGENLAGTAVVRIGAVDPGKSLAADKASARRLIGPGDFLTLSDKGGPELRRRSLTEEFPGSYPPDCRIEGIAATADAQFVSLRQAGPLLGAGLIDAIAEETILANMMRQAARHPDLVGRTNPVFDPLTRQSKVGRFGWKGEDADLLLATAGALGTELGVTTYVRSTAGSGMSAAEFPACIVPFLPGEPNDGGGRLVSLADFLALLAPPPEPFFSRDARRGQAIFDRLRCAVCHTPELPSAPRVEIPDPQSPFPRLEYIEVKALENQPVRLYSDLLLHDMGDALADGIVQASARGGEWRTTPLWGIRYKKRFLHDGRARSVEEAILAHGGQACPVVDAFNALAAGERRQLIEFVQSL